MYHDLRVEIIRKFKTQADFCLVLGWSESKTSSILNGRRKLKESEAEQWKKLLACDGSLIDAVTKNN